MKVIRNLILAGAALLTATAPLHAFDLAGKTYLSFDAGGAFMQNLQLKNTSAQFTFNAGYRTDLAAGYNFNDSLSLQLESGLIQNTVEQVGFQVGSITATQAGQSATLSQIPILVDLIYRLPIEGRCVPFIGGGVGGVVSLFDFNGPTEVNLTDFTMGYQGIAGFTYAATDRFDIGLSYKFFGTLDHDWTQNSLSIKTKGAMTQCVVVTGAYKF